MPAVNPPQPPGGEYPLSKLTPTYIREFTNQAGYFKATGKTAAAYNPDLPIKTWDDTRKFGNPTDSVEYTVAILDASMQFPVIRHFTIPVAVAQWVNIPPDEGPIPPSTAGFYTRPIRSLLSNERPNPREGGQIDIINTDIFDPNPQQTAIALLKRICGKLGA